MGPYTCFRFSQLLPIIIIVFLSSIFSQFFSPPKGEVQFNSWISWIDVVQSALEKTIVGFEENQVWEHRFSIIIITNKGRIGSYCKD